jgi:purine-binding chemotaxis protein CheW
MTTNFNQPSLDVEDGEVSDNRQYVTFLIGDDVFAVDMAPVQEIIRVPSIVRVPLAPASLDGLSNLRGKVLPIISLRRIFGITDSAYDDSTRAIVIDMGQPLGFVVDRVASVINVEPEKIEDVTEIKSTINSELLIGILKNVSGYPMVMVLDFNKLITNEFSGIESLVRSVSAQQLNLDQQHLDEDDELSNERQLVSFSVASQEYAVDINNVQEIVQVPESIVHVPKADTHVLGIMTLRDRLLPLVSLRSLFHLPVQPLDERSRVVVVALHGMSVGVVTDSVSEVLRVPLEFIDPIPPLLAKDTSLADITQICRLQQGKRIVSIISTENMFKHSAVVQAIKDTEQMIDQDSDSENSELLDDDEEQMVVFHLADGEFGVPIRSVQEIVRIPDELTHVPKAPEFIEGVINLRGAVLPVIDQRRRLGMPATDRNDRQRIMVFSIGGIRTGFIVDGVTEVLKVPKKSIEAAPKLSVDQAHLLGRVANLELQNRMIQLIDPDYLVDQHDRKALTDASV